ncbi:LOW QUALITY PROTEIN: uncharacterized protein FYW47_011834 [Aplochiton taeniatus]
MSPDFVLMRLVSAAEYDRLDEEELISGGGGVVSGFGNVKAALGHHGNNINNGFELDPSSRQAGLGTGSPHYSSPLDRESAALDSGMVPARSSGSETPISPPANAGDFAVAQHFDYPVQQGAGRGSRAQLIVFQNLLRSSEGILDCGLEQPSPGFHSPVSGQAEGREVGSGNSCGVTTTTASSANGDHHNNTHGMSSDVQQQQFEWHPAMKLSKAVTEKLPAGAVPQDRTDTGLCHRHRLLTERLADWPPGLLEKTLRFGILEPRKGCPDGAEDPVITLARRLGELGQASQLLLREGAGAGGGEGGEDMVLPLPRCSCHSILSSAAGRLDPGEDPSESSDALLVLEGLGSEEVGGALDLGEGERGESRDGRVGGGAASVFSSGTLSGLMRQVQRLAEEAGVCTDHQSCRPPVAAMGTAPGFPTSTFPCSAPASAPSPLQQVAQASAALAGLQARDIPLPSSSSRPQHQSRSQPQSRATTPKLGMASGGLDRAPSPLVVLEAGGGGGAEGEKPPRGKSRKGGSLKVRLSKLFRTKSSSGGSGGLLDKRPSLASSTSSGGSLLDVWGSTSSTTTEQDTGRLHSAFSPVSFSPAFTGETVSLVDVDISRRGGASSLHPPTPPPPPRRSLSLLDDFGGPQQQPGPYLDQGGGASMQSLPPRPQALPPSLNPIQHSLSLNDTFLRGLPRPIPLQPGAPPPSRLTPRPLLCPLSRRDAGSFASSLRELEKCGWYWGPMNWEDAEMKLKGKPDGSFLVRDSSDPRYILSLSFRSQGVTHHTRMEHYRGTFSLWCHPKFEDRCHSVVEFIERAIMHSKNGKFLYFLRSRVPGLPPTPVQLLYPVSRFSSVKSLQHLCRFCIRQLVRIDHIQELPLPTPLILYLGKFYYYDPEEEMYMSVKDRGRDQNPQPVRESQT